MKLSMIVRIFFAVTVFPHDALAGYDFFPIVDLREFYNFTRYIWTYVGTAPNTFCKVDHPLYEVYKEVMFTRNVSGLGQQMLKGTFVDTDSGRFSTSYPYGPTIMQISGSARQNEFTEQVVYEDDQQLCGVFLTFNDAPLSQEYKHWKYERWIICEIRMKGNRQGPYYTPACFGVFNALCGRNTYQIYTKACSK
ncbi:uncharacterized protein LOC144142223 [Haemaphysalis longicornis]